MADLENLKQLVIDLEVDEVAGAVQKALDDGAKPLDVLAALTDGMNEVGRLYEAKEFYLTELVLAGETMKEAFSVLEPSLKGVDAGKKVPVVAATVRGDQHDIGKNILLSLLISGGYEIIDLGMDVPAEKIVATVKERGAKIVALSSLLTMTVEEINAVHKLLQEEGIRDQVKIIVGGAPLNRELAEKLGADEYADDATEGARLIAEMAEKM
ncbi:MAG: cobalamin-dependent protein [Promethearchaeota archaeon]